MRGNSSLVAFLCASASEMTKAITRRDGASSKGAGSGTGETHLTQDYSRNTTTIK